MNRLPLRTKRALVIILYDRKEMWLAISNRTADYGSSNIQPKWIFIWAMESQRQSQFENILHAYRFDENQ